MSKLDKVLADKLVYQSIAKMSRYSSEPSSEDASLDPRGIKNLIDGMNDE
jgi:hypothetical protein